MSVIWTRGGPYQFAAYADEADLEATVIKVQKQLFGPNRVYLDAKKEDWGQRRSP